MDPTMKRTRIGSIVAIVISLLLVPVVWYFGFDAIPPLKVVEADKSGGRLGPWLFTWALVWVATLSCVGVAWLCYTSVDDATS